MQLRPLGNKVIIKPDDVERELPSGFVVTGSERPMRGEIVALPNPVPDHFIVRVGDSALYERFAGSDITVGDVTYLCIDYDDIFAVVRE